MSMSAIELAALEPSLNIALQAGYRGFQEARENWVKDLLETITEYDLSVTLPFSRDSGFIRETFKGQPPKYETFLADKATINLQIWESAIKLSIYDVSKAMRTKYADLFKQAQEIAMNAAFLPLDLVIRALRLGDTSAYLMYDLQNFFANAHPKGGTTYDNLQAGALTDTNFQAIRTIMARFPSDAGASEPLGVMGNVLVTPPDMDTQAKRLMNNEWSPEQVTSGGRTVGAFTENVLAGSAVVRSDARLTDVDDWFLLAQTPTQKPFLRILHGEFSPFRIHPEVDENSDAFKNHHEYRFWGRTVETVFPRHPYQAIKVVN